MFKKIFIENDIQDNIHVQKILKKLNINIPRIYIDSYTDVFEKVKKPYLQKRDNLNLFLAQKKGDLVKATPEAYGFSDNQHFYFYHSLNCIYECEYCYLQGYFNSPDIVHFVNYEEIGKEIQKISKQATKEKPIWFHMGEFSDSLALSSLSDDISYYFNLFKNLDHSYLELRTKSTNIKNIIKNSPLKNVITSFTLGPESISAVEKKVPSTSKRISCMAKLKNMGFKIGLHLDPIIYHPDYQVHYGQMIQDLAAEELLPYFEYISIGVVRYTKDSHRQLLLNYPNTICSSDEFIKSFDGKIRYPRPIRIKILTQIKSFLTECGAKKDSIYLCME